MKILLADDDRVSRRIMERKLQQSGYEVVTASNGREAAEELSKLGAPRLALLNWMMPELDGPSVCREVRSRQDSSYVYIVLLTSKASNDDIVKGLQAGADDYLTTPCDSEELKARLHAGRRILELENKLVEAREEMRFKATHDALTSLWDRGAILALLRSELSRSVRTRKPVSLLLCDVDHFKNINDSYGHQVGDAVLEEVSNRLRMSVRIHDAVGRYGGEEFLMVLSDCSTTHLRSRAEHVRNAIGSSPFITEQGPLSVCVSVGAMTIEEWTNSAAMEPLLKRVDMALYRAKSSGRNQVAFA